MWSRHLFKGKDEKKLCLYAFRNCLKRHDLDSYFLQKLIDLLKTKNPCKHAIILLCHERLLTFKSRGIQNTSTRVIVLSGFLGLWKSGIPVVFQVFQAIFNIIPSDIFGTLCNKKEIQDLLLLKKDIHVSKT